jgi:hypothetical protein
MKIRFGCFGEMNYFCNLISIQKWGKIMEVTAATLDKQISYNRNNGGLW